MLHKSSNPPTDSIPTENLSKFIKQTSTLFNSNPVLLQGLVLFILTTTLVFYNLKTPNHNVFDETYYIPSAQRYINGAFFLQSHPPLGKLLIALGQSIYQPDTGAEFINQQTLRDDWTNDMDITGYRIAPAVFGCFVPLLIYLILSKILKNNWLAFGLALLVAFDTTFLILARIAMLDVFLFFFIFLGIYLFILLQAFPQPDAKFYRLLAFFALVAACAANVKDTGLILFVPLAYLFFKYGWKKWKALLSIGAIFSTVFLTIYLGLWALHFSITPNLIGDYNHNVSHEYQQILDSISPDLNRAQGLAIKVFYAIKEHYIDLSGISEDEFTSPWYKWPLGGKAILFRWLTEEGTYFKSIVFVGNPITWLLSFLGVLFGTAAVLSDIFFKHLRENAIRSKRLLVFFVSLYWLYLIPFWPNSRATYIYYYIPAMIFGLIILGLSLSLTEWFSSSTAKWLISIAIICVVITFWIYRPFIYYLPLTLQQYGWRTLWPIWQLPYPG